jgi:Na+/H+-dicarboxylate symporter
VTTVSGSGSQNLAGSGTGLIAALQTAFQAAALLGTWIWFARGEANGERLMRASAASVVAFVAFGKVLSPQFMIWLCPFVLLVRGKRGIATSALLVASLVLTQLWFPYRYWDYALGFDALPSAFVFLRDVVLIGIFATLLAGSRRREQALPAVQAAPIQSGI